MTTLSTKIPSSKFTHTDKMTPPPTYKPNFLDDMPYHKHIKSLHKKHPHLEALTQYADAIDKGRVEGRLGSHDSDSILVIETSYVTDESQVYRIDCYDPKDVLKHKRVLSTRRDDMETKARVVIVEDLSPGAIEVLGASYNLDAHVFYYHLGFDTRDSAMMGLVDPKVERSIPMKWCVPGHGPSDFFSIPMPCDLKPIKTHESEKDVSMDSTYARQVYRPIVQLTASKKPTWSAPQRAFHRLSVIFPDSGVQTVIILAFPTWKRRSRTLPGVTVCPLNEIIDSFGYPLVPTSIQDIVLLMRNTNAAPGMRVVKNGALAPEQWERVQPLFKEIIPETTSRGREEPGAMQERALLWLYSKMSMNYHLASQCEQQCWSEVRELLEPTNLKRRGHISQRPKRQLRDAMTTTAELLELSKDWLDKTLKAAREQDTLQKLQLKVDVTLKVEKSRIAEVLLNINDEQNEVQMDLMALQLEENRHAISQAVSVGRLTKLAFFFVPLTTVGTIFGMNVREMDNHPPVWLFVLISVVCTITAMFFASMAPDIVRQKFEDQYAKLKGEMASLISRSPRKAMPF